MTGRGPPRMTGKGPAHMTGSRKGDGPGRGDNRGRRRAKLRGGGAGAPVRSTPKGSEHVHGDALRCELQLACRKTPAEVCPERPANRDESGQPDPHTGMAPRTRGAIDREPARVTRACIRLSQRDKPDTIRPSVDCLHVGAQLSHGGRQTLVGRLDSMSTATRRQRKPLTFRAIGCSTAGQVRRPARTASQIRCPSAAPATTAWAQCPSHSPSPSPVPVAYAASAPV